MNYPNGDCITGTHHSVMIICISPCALKVSVNVGTFPILWFTISQTYGDQ